ncbi:S-layer homology domain-containing protein [Cloacibacillus evryensis]|uniref:S-layer homology domain-containing protein n=1 Tax=Cloacibacillus evryensis TaxID=508460 RepID=UPI00210B220C|nr:S-layer homology domain-containing protein [Cloacibacillus evryensis]MCQ4763305.1 S-layer homology domain-containing protein [Cloacibacillus evryensis]
MKKFMAVLAMVAVVAFAAPALAATNPFMDVPQGHWAYDAVGLLASRGIVSGYPDGAFKGAQPATRYEMASVVARALVAIDADKASKQDLELLKKLVMEFKDELDALGVKVDKLDKRVAVLEKNIGGWKINGNMWFDAKFASNADNDYNSYNEGAKKNEFTMAYARIMFTKYIDDNTYFFWRFRADGQGDLDNWWTDRFFVNTKLPYDINLRIGRQYSDWEGDAGLYHSVMGDNEGGLWKDFKYDGFNLQKSWKMIDAELLIGRNDNVHDTNSKFVEDNNFMTYGLKLQANFSEKFYAGLMGLYFDPDNLDGDYKVQQYGAYASFAFTPAVALRGYYYWQKLGDDWGAEETSPKAWSALLDIKQDLLKFTSLYVQYVQQDNSFLSPRAAGAYPAVFGSAKNAPTYGSDGTNKTWLVTAEQKWNDKWSSFLQYMSTDWDYTGTDDTKQYMIGVGYQYTPAIKFWLAYDGIDYGDQGKYTGKESVVLFRTVVNF